MSVYSHAKLDSDAFTCIPNCMPSIRSWRYTPQRALSFMCNIVPAGYSGVYLLYLGRIRECIKPSRMHTYFMWRASYERINTEGVWDKDESSLFWRRRRLEKWLSFECGFSPSLHSVHTENVVKTKECYE